MAVCCDAGDTEAARGAPARWSSLRHFRASDKAVRALGLQYVPCRFIVDYDGNVAKCWDGTAGKVVGGKHGGSRTNCSTELADEIAAVLERMPTQQHRLAAGERQ